MSFTDRSSVNLTNEEGKLVEELVELGEVVWLVWVRWKL